MSEESKKKIVKIAIIVLILIIVIVSVIYFFRKQINNEVSINTVRKKEWDSQASLIEKVVELNESLSYSSLDVDFNLKKVCTSTDYKKPNNITNNIMKLTDFNDNDTIVGCYIDGPYTSVIIISIGNFGTQYVKKINFYNYAIAVKNFDFIVDGKRVECTLNSDKTISCN